MMTLILLLILCVLTSYGGGVTKNVGVKQFWTDDFKVFEQVYGKTSDKDLYGATLPPTITFTLDIPKPQVKASEKRERYLTDDDIIAESQQQLYPYAFGDRYAKLFAKNIVQPTKKKFGLKFIGVDSKPISESSDPETYNYLKRLEKQQQIEFPQEEDFSPYISLDSAKKLEDTDAYKSIQDILDAHEANKNGNKVNDEEHNKYLGYGTSKGRNKVRLNSGNHNNLTKGPKSRCRSGRCRKRYTSGYRAGARPYLRTIKHRLIRY